MLLFLRLRKKNSIWVGSSDKMAQQKILDAQENIILQCRRNQAKIYPSPAEPG